LKNNDIESLKSFFEKEPSKLNELFKNASTADKRAFAAEMIKQENLDNKEVVNLIRKNLSQVTKLELKKASASKEVKIER
jgi:hypothetical protein